MAPFAPACANTFSFLNPDTCASKYETDYFLTGALPPVGTICQQNLPPFAS